MNYSEAATWINNHLSLVGTKDEKGFFVSELLIVPASPANREVFLRNYLFGVNKEAAIFPYVQGDVQVWSIDLERFKHYGILFYDVLAQ